MFIINICGIDNPLPLLMAKRMVMVKGEGVGVGVTMVWHCRSLCVGLAQCLLPCMFLLLCLYGISSGAARVN